MKKIKQTTKIMGIALGMLFLFHKASAQITVNLNVAPGYVAQYMCIGSTYIVNFTGLPSGYNVYNSSIYYNWTYGSPGCVTYGNNAIELCLSNSNYVIAAITAVIQNAVGDQQEWTFYVSFYPYITTVTGPVSVCEGSSETYTCITNIPGVIPGNYIWGIPSILSGTLSTTDLQATTATSVGLGNVCVSVVSSTGQGCPAASESSWSCEDVHSVSGPPPAPCCLQFKQAGRACWCDSVTWSPIIGAVKYEWSYNASFTPYYTTTVAGIHGYFPYSYCSEHYHHYYTYTYYVRAINVCGLKSPIARLTASTPCKPEDCFEVISPDSINSNYTIETSGEETIGDPDDYKIYPNPASNQLTIEYPPGGASAQTLTIYDMLGKKIGSYELPAPDDIISLNVSNLPMGLFMYSISSGDEIVQRGKIMIQR